MAARKAVISTLVVFIIVCCGIQVQQQHQGWPRWSEKQQQHGRGTKQAPWSSQVGRKQCGFGTSVGQDLACQLLVRGAPLPPAGGC